MGAAIVRVLDNPEHYVKSLRQIDAVFGFEQTVDAYEALLRDAAQAGRTGRRPHIPAGGEHA